MMHVLPVLLLVLIGFSAFFAMAEVAFVSLNKIRLRYLLARGEKNAEVVHRIVKKMDKLITTVLVGNNFVNIAISAIGTAIFITVFGNNFTSIAVSTLVVTLLVLILGEITPKIFAVKHAEKVSLRVAWFMDFLINGLEPLVKVFLNICNRLLRIFGEEPPRRSPLVTQEEIRLMIELGKEEGVVSDGERSMLHRIFEFGETLVNEVMLPAEKIAAIDINATPEELLDIIIEEGHSRIPVYEGGIQNIRGVVYARELLNVWRDRELVVVRDLLHPPYFIAPNKRVSELLREFQRTRVYMAIVADDKKNTIGLVTLEDLLEEIVGEIEDNAG
ncbi:MAG: hemolysin family protein [Candidatus Omnitrophica bacterium]|jgi:Hemolysins and related proteins containing CBS domains|nr:hemolysin family protein [Candidatus Omnitrophota bacterium]